MNGRLRLTVVAAVVAAAGLAPAHAAVDQLTFTGSRWATFNVSVAAGGVLGADVSVAYTKNEAVGLAWWILDSTRSVVASGGIHQAGTEPQVYLSYQSILIVDQWLDSTGGTVATGGTIAGLPAGTYTVVEIGTSISTSTVTATLTGDGVTEISSANGVAFIDDKRSFDSTITATAGAGVVARAMYQASVSHSATGRMFAVFSVPEPTILSAIGWTGPSGAHDGDSAYILSGEPKGGYRFRVDSSVGLDDLLFGGLTLFGASIPIA